MEDLWNSIRDWPAIVQGALGSALFWLFLSLMQRIFDWSSKMYGKHSTAARSSWLISHLTKCEAFDGSGGSYAAFNVSTLVYRSLRPFYRAIMWLCIGLILQLTLEINGVIGFIGCLFYLFKAYEVISPLPDDFDHKGEADLCIKELQEMGVLPRHEENNSKEK